MNSTKPSRSSIDIMSQRSLHDSRNPLPLERIAVRRLHLSPIPITRGTVSCLRRNLLGTSESVRRVLGQHDIPRRVRLPRSPCPSAPCQVQAPSTMLRIHSLRHPQLANILYTRPQVLLSISAHSLSIKALLRICFLAFPATPATLVHRRFLTHRCTARVVFNLVFPS